MNAIRFLPTLGFFLVYGVLFVWGDAFGVSPQNTLLVAFFLGFCGALAAVAGWEFARGVREA
ncbi:hypothetical protein [Halogeometricum limi]|uniref:Uncharacterized protein n=1 Tax=Halogeometricum limi TaxID=555875 RepID=A0A1I6HMB7_9EURY|nr:hypothetical protein [Halogeometricum limi]SFR55554.1 hypothetical protein SAMN04488124_2392 [Halogeometricum limi]